MSGLFAWPSLSGQSWFGLMMVVGYPALVLAALEVARSVDERREFASSILRQVAYLLLPTGAVWLILRGLADLPPDNWAVRSAKTAFALTALYLLLRVAQAALMAVVDNRRQAPKLLLDILRIGLSLVWGAVVISRIWDVDLGSLFAAMGVGSIVLGFALQEFLGNLLSGLGLLSAHKFGVGDWIVVDGSPARVLEMDWRTVTLAKGDTRLVVANSTLAKGNLVLAARSGDVASITVPLSFGLDVPPEAVRDAVLEAALGLPELAGASPAKCMVTAVGDEAVSYAAVLPVADPGILSGPRDEFLSRFWYVAQRRGLRLGAAGSSEAGIAPDAGERLRMLSAAGAFHGDTDALAALAAGCALRRYRRTDIVTLAGAPATQAFFVLAGSLAVSVPNSGGEMRLELVEPGQLLVLHETLAGGTSPVQVVAQENADVLAIPAKCLHAVMERNRVIARDVAALAEARRLAIQPLNRRLRAVREHQEAWGAQLKRPPGSGRAA